jgi:hypothetical protein
MSCLQSLKGLSFNECETNLAGVKAIWLTDQLDNLVVTASTSALTVSQISGATFYKYGMDEGQGYLTSTSSVGDTGRIRYFTNEIRIAFPKLSAERHAEFMALTHNPVKAIVLDNNDVYHYVSYDKYLRANDGATAMTGQSDDDNNGYEVLLSGKSAYPSFIVDEAAAKAVISEPDAVGA